MRDKRASCMSLAVTFLAKLPVGSSLVSQFQENSALRAAEALSLARSVLFVTGAGISAESGLPTYRGVTGLYNANDGMVEEGGMTIEECLSGRTYRAKPALTWKYLLQIERACRGAEPSAAHRMVAATERYVKGPVTVMTQNVDGLHGRAGSTDVVCLHGELYSLRCDGGGSGLSPCGSTKLVESYANLESKGEFPPVCDCGGTMRPNVVLFDEYLGDETVRKYEDRLGISMGDLLWTWRDADSRSGGKGAAYDVSISIGTSALFGYVNAAALSGKTTIEINPTRTELSDLVDIRVGCGATETLNFIFEKLGWKV